MATAELTEINRTIRSAMGESAGTFRRAANDNTNLMSKVSKEISNVFAKQRAQISSLNDNIEEVALHSQQTSSKIDRLSNIMSESIAIQNQMSASMKSMVDGIYSTNKSILNVNNSLTGAGGIAGLLGNVFGKFGEIAGLVLQLGPTIKDAILGLATAGGAAALINQSLSGGGAATGPMGKGLGESGSSSEAMSFFQSKGWTKEQAAGIVGNLQTESGKNLRTNAVGDNGQAYGIAQWHPDRQRKFQEVMGIPIRQANFKQQLEFVNWELNNTEKRAGQMLKGASSAIEAARAVDYGYERSTHQHLGQRMANAVALAKSENKSDTKAASSTTPSATEQGTTPTAHADKVEQHGGHDAQGHIISGAEHQQKAEASANLPSGDIVALGNSLKKMGMDISEHPQFGGVHPVHKGKAHYEGRAIDINLTHGKDIEANNPVAGAKFDQLAAQLSKLGYKVFWRESGPYGAAGHNNHLHAELPRGGAQATPDKYQVPGTPENQAAQGATPLSSSGATSPTSSGEQQTSILQSPAFQQLTGGMMGGGLAGAIGEFQKSYDTGNVSNLTGGGMPGMGNIMGMMGGGMGGMLGGGMMGGGMMGGGMGGMMGMLGPLLGMATSALPSGAQQPAGQMLNFMSQAAGQTEQLNRQAVEREAQNQISTEVATQAATDKAVEDTNTRNANRNEGRPIASDYNRPDDKHLVGEWMQPLRSSWYDQFMGGFIKGA